RRQPNTRRPCISYGSFCTTIALRYRSWRTIRSPTRRLITSARDFIVTSLPHSATKRGGNANQLVTGCRNSPPMTPSFAVCSRQWIGSIDGTHDEACSGDQRECSGAYRRARVAVLSLLSRLPKSGNYLG